MTTPVTDLHRALAEVAQEASAEYSRRNKMRTKEGRREAIAQALAEKMGPIGRYEANTALNFPVAVFVIAEHSLPPPPESP